MTEFIFIDSAKEKYSISFGWRDKKSCTVCVYPQKYNRESLAMCTFGFTNNLHVDENLAWAVEYLSPEVEAHINRLIKNRMFW